MNYEILVSSIELHGFLSEISKNTQDFHPQDEIILQATKEIWEHYDLITSVNKRRLSIECKNDFHLKMRLDILSRFHKLLKLLPDQPLTLIIDDNLICIKSINL